jgi:hypothetical protein
MRFRHAACGLAASALAFTPAFALPASAETPTEALAPAVDPADVASMDSIIAALYDVISGPAGEARDWDRMRSLFVAGARLMPRSLKDPAGVRIWSVEDYIANAGPTLEKDGFFEREIGRTTEVYGDIAHVFSAYDSKRTAEDAEPFARGVNSIQLLKHNGRWWVVSIFWQGETPENKVPARYLNK